MENRFSELTQGKSYGNISIFDGKAHIGDTYNFGISKNADHGAELQLIQSLAFPESLTRYDAIEETHPETFEWLFTERKHSQRWASFPDWLKNGSDIYLIEGKAGSGKSTLMKFIANHDVTKETFFSVTSRHTKNVLTYFFWLAGTELQKSFRGLLASLAHQAAVLWPSQAKICDESRRERKCLDDWTTTDLEHFLLNLLALSEENTLILVDGLDEFDHDERPIKLVSFLNNLVSCANVKLCVSSRPLTWVQEGLTCVSKVMLHELTRFDIDKFAADVLHREFKLSGYRSDSELTELLAIIREKAEGVFLWAKYALHTLAEGLDEFDDAVTLKMRLEALPAGMEELYMHTWERFQKHNAQHRDEAAIFFQCARRYPLRLFDVAIMTDSELYKYYLDTPAKASADLLKHAIKRTRRKLMMRTAGLLTCQADYAALSSDTFYHIWPPEAGHDDIALRDSCYFVNVTYIHRTVEDFLFATTYGQSITRLSTNQQQDLDNRWCYSLVATLSQGWVDWSWSREVQRLCQRLSFLEHVERCPTPSTFMKIIDAGLRTFVSLLQDVPDSTSWFYALLQAKTIEPGYVAVNRVVNTDFGALLIAEGAFESLKNLLAGREVGKEYLTYLSCCTLDSVEDYVQDALYPVPKSESKFLGMSKTYLPFLKWLMDRGTDPGLKVVLPAVVYACGIETLRLLRLSPLDILSNIIISKFSRPNRLFEMHVLQTLLQTLLDATPTNTIAFLIYDTSGRSGLQPGNEISLRLNNSAPTVAMSISMTELLRQLYTYSRAVDESFDDISLL